MLLPLFERIVLLKTTASDLAALYQMMLNGGTFDNKRLLSRPSVNLMTTLQLQSEGTYGHGGAFGTQGWIDPQKDLVGVFLIQRSGGGGPDETNAFKALAAAAIAE